MVTEREARVLRLALVYASANLDDVIVAFRYDGTPKGKIDFNGEIMKAPTEDEIEKLINLFQG